MGNDGVLVKTACTLAEIERSSSSVVDEKPREEEFQGFDGARVLEIGGKVDDSGDGVGGDGAVGDIDVNMPVKELSTSKNLEDRTEGVENDSVVDSEIEKQSKEGEFGNGEIDQIGGINGDDGLTRKVEFSVDDGDKDNSELVNDYDGEDKASKTPRRRGRRPKIEGGGSSNSEMKGDPDKKAADFSSGISQRTRNRVVKGRKEDDEDMDVEMNASEVDGEGDRETGFCVGNFVWGKIKSYPWWPGRIYSPSNASEFALKYKHEGRLLVAYFGDGTFAWCDPSQLKPFEQNFEEMSRQSSLRSFVSAVEEAVEEFGRLVERKMTSSCAIKGSQSSLPPVVNTGIKEGVHVPLAGVENFSVDKFEPTVILDNIRSFARFDSVANLLELRVVKSLISIYYHSKGVYSLPTYYEPMGIEELIHPDAIPKEGSALGPDDGDWFVGPGDDSLMQNGLETSSDMARKSRKVKSIAELLGIGTKTELEENHVDGAKGKMQPRKLASKSGKKRQKVANEDQAVSPKLDGNETGTTTKEVNQSGNLALKSGRKRKILDENRSHSAENSRITRSSASKREGSKTFATSRKRAANVKEDVNGEKDQTETGKSLRHQKMSVNLRIENVLTSEEGPERMSPRERKKSKYLSPPYTSLLEQKQRSSGLNAGSESGVLEFSDVAKMGEKMSKASGKLVGSPPILKCSAEMFQKSSRGVGSAHGKTGTNHSDHKTRNLRSKVDDSVKSIGSPNSVLCEIRSAALDPIYLMRKDQSFDTVKGFLSSYRDANYKNGSNYRSFKTQMSAQRKRKRKMPETNNGSDGNAQNQVGKHPSEPHTPGKSTSKKKEQRSDSKADPTSSAALVIRFPPEFTLPSKEDLLKIHSRFGPLDESKSKVTAKSSTAKIVFVKSLDAEAAKNSFQQSSPFDTAKISYKIKHLPAAESKTKKPKSQNKKKSESSETQKQKSSDKHLPGVAENEPLAVVFIKQKLEAMTSMLGQTDGKMTEEVKTNLENEVKELLKKVKLMTASSSS